MIKQGAIVGTIAGLIVVGTKTLYDTLNYKPDTGTSMFTFPSSSAGAFGQAPFLGIAFSLPFGAVIGIIIGVIFNYLGPYNLVRWPIVNAILGAILGWFIVRTSFKVCEYVFFETSSYNFGIIGLLLLILTPLLSDLHIPGAMIGAIVGFLLKRNG